MTDPVSVSASIAGLVSLADTVFKKAYRYTIDARGASDEVKNLVQSIRALCGILHQLLLIACQLEREAFKTTIQIDHISSCYLTIEKMGRILEKYESSSGQLSTLKKLKWPFSSSEARTISVEIERHKSTFSLALGVDSFSTLLKALSGQKEFQNSIDGVRIDIRQWQEAKSSLGLNNERQKILEWIQPHDPYQHHKMNLRLRHAATGLWFIDGEGYKSWLRTSNSKLWCYGIPGAGKSVLCATIIHEALSRSCAKTAIAFYYCDYKHTVTQNPRNILGSLVKQLAVQSEDSFAKLQKFYREKFFKDLSSVDFELEDLCDLIISMASSFDDVMVVVDALDECGTQVKLVTQLLASLGNSVEAQNIKCLFLSRDEVDIRSALKDYDHASIAANSDDLRIFVGAEIELRILDGDLRIRDQSLKLEIMERLVEGADGMFRWVVCQIDWLCQLPHDDARRKALTALPPTLHATYQRILRRVNDTDKEVRKLVCKTLRWLVCSRGMLSSVALCEAVSVSPGDTTLNRAAIPDQNDIRRWCSSLVRKSATGNFLELAHFTVQEYLLGANDSLDPGLSIYHFTPELADIELAKICLTYLAFEDFNELIIYSEKSLKARHEKFAFLSYAVEFWEEHAREHLADAEMSRSTQQLLHPSKPHVFIAWAQERVRAVRSEYFYENDDLDLASANPLHFAAAMALPEICSWLMSTKCNVMQSSALGNPLDCALIGPEVMKALGRDLPYSKTLSAERQASRSSTIKIILESGANVKVSCIGSSPFCIAASLSDDISCVELLRRGATLDTQSASDLQEQPELAYKVLTGIDQQPIRSKDRAVLLEAALHMEKATSNDLLAFHVRDAQEDRVSKTDLVKPLMNAAQHGQTNVLRTLLIDHKLDTDVFDEDYDGTALHLAASKDHIETVKYLLEVGASCKLKDHQGRTPLHRCFDTSSSSLLIILEQIDDINVADHEGITAWHLAAFNHDTQALKTLSRFATNGTPQYGLQAKDGRTPVHCAAQSGSVETLSYLLDYCNSIFASAKSANGSTVLHYAVGTRSPEIVKYLSDSGFDFPALRNDASNLLHCAIDQKLPAASQTLEIIVKKGVDPCQTRSDGMTAIDVLISKGHDIYRYEGLCSSLEMLTKYVTELDFTNTDKRSALYQVCQIHTGGQYWKTKALRILLETGVSPSSRDHLCRKALQYVVESLTNAEPPVAYTMSSQSAIADALQIVLAGFKDKSSKLRVFTDPHILCLALMWRQDDLASEILQHIPSVDVAAPQVNQMSPLEVGCFYGSNSPLLRKLIEQSKVDKGVAGSSWSLFLVIFSGKALDKRAITNILLEAGYNANDCNSKGQSVLMRAAEIGDCKIVEDLIEHGADRYAVDPEGWSLIHYACVSENTDLLQFLIGQIENWTLTIEFDLNDLLIQNATILHLAASCEGCSLQFLLQNRLVADLNRLTRHNESPLHIAVLSELADNVSLLLDAGADDEVLNIRDGCSALHLAAWTGNLEVVKLFVEKGCNFRIHDRLGLSPELIARREGHNDVADFLGKAMSVTADGIPARSFARPSSELLRLAIERGDTKLCRALIAEGVNCEKGFAHCNGCPPMLYACIREEFEIAKLLVSKGASIIGSSCSLTWARGWTPFHHAAGAGDAELLRLLCETAPHEIRRRDQSVHPLHLAIANSRAECVEMIVAEFRRNTRGTLTNHDFEQDENTSQGVNIRVCESRFLWCWNLSPHCTFAQLGLSTASALHIAASTSTIGITQFLIDSGALVECTDKNLWTPLHFAADRGRIDMIDLLVRNGANIDAVDSLLRTPLMLAAGQVRSPLNVIAKLVDYGSDLTLRSQFGRSPVYFAAQALRWDNVMCLLSHPRPSGSDKSLFHDDPSFTDTLYPHAPLFLLSFLFNYAVDSSLYAPNKRNILSSIAFRNDMVSLKMLMRRLPKNLISRLLVHQDTYWGTPLYTAATIAADKVIDMLLAASAELELEGGKHGTPLMGACATGRLKIVKMLVSRGAKTSYVKDGQVIDAFSTARNHPNVRRWLLVGRYTGLRFITTGED